MIRAVIADDNPVLRFGIVSYFGLHDDIEVVAEASDGEEAVDATRRHRPDVLLLDVRMPKLDGIAVLDRLAELGIELGVEGVAVLMLTNSDDQATIQAAMSRGASGYLVYPDAEAVEIADAVRRVARGEVMLASRAASQLVSLLSAPPPDHAAAPPGSDREERARRFHLSTREAEVIELVATGCSNGEIAERLYIAEKTVKNHLNRIFAKLHAAHRAEAMAIWRGERGPT